MSSEVKFVNNKHVCLSKVVTDGFSQIQDGEGFEYIIGEIKGGKLKVVFEPDSDNFQSLTIDGVNGFGYTLAFEEW